MNLTYAVASFLTFLICSAVGVFVYTKGRNLITNRLYSLLSFSTALWSIGIFMHAIVTDPSMCLFWGRFSHIGASFIPVFYLMFIVKLIKPDSKIDWILPPFLIIALGYSILSFNKNFFTGVSPKINFTQWADPGFLYWLFVVYFLSLPIAGCVYLIINYNSQLSIKKNQLKYVGIASLLGFTGGSSTFLTVYGLEMPFIHSYGLYFVSAYNLIIAYAIIRHQLMDIEVIIKKTLVYAGLFTFAFGVIVGVALITQELISQFLLINRFVSLAISAVIIIFSLRPLENFLINATNKFLFQKKYDPRKILKEFADEVLTILNLDRLCRMTIDTLVNNLYLKNCAVLLLTPDETGYEIYDSFGIKDKNAYLDNEIPLIARLKTTYLPVLYQGYDRHLQASDDVKKDMDKIKSHLCMPLIIHNEMVGILTLGSKKSDQAYNADDVDILTTLVKALSIAISNARLFAQAAQYEKLAAIGTLASGINHEVCNPLNNISVQMQVFIEGLKRGLYEGKGRDDIINDTKVIMEDSIKQIHRVAGITSKLSSFAKPSREVVAKPVDVARSVEDALGIVGHELELNKIKIEKDIPAVLPKIMADEDQMQQVFFNLIKNAAEAIKENGTITITAREDDNKIKVEVTDTGRGIPEDKLSKVFEPFYTTKGKAKGSGFGLAIVRELMWRNKSDISVKSKVGKRTTFYLEFPKA